MRTCAHSADATGGTSAGGEGVAAVDGEVDGAVGGAVIGATTVGVGGAPHATIHVRTIQRVCKLARSFQEHRTDSRSTRNAFRVAWAATPPSPAGLTAAREQLEAILGRSVDLVDLERASPILAMQVRRHGRLVVDRTTQHRVRFTAALPGRYEDVRIMRRPAEKILRGRLAHGRT